MFSKIKSKVKSAATKVGSKIKNVASNVRNAVNSAADSLAASSIKTSKSQINQNNLAVNKIIASKGDGKSTPNPAANQTLIQNSTQFNPSSKDKLAATFARSNPGVQSNPFVGKPVSYRSGSKPSMGASGSWGTSDYTSPSYSTDVAGDTETFVSGSGSPSNQTISSGTLGAGTTSFVMPSAPTGNDYSSEVIGNNIKVGASPMSGMIEAPDYLGNAEAGTTTATDQPTEGRQALDEMLASLRQPASEADLYNKALKRSGLEKALAQRNNTQNAINAVTTQMNTDLLKLRGTAAQEGVTEAVYGGQQAQISREATIKLLPLQAQLAVDQDNVELAEEYTNNLFKMYAADAKSSAEFYNKQVEKVYEFLTAEQKERVDSKKSQKEFTAGMVKEDAKQQRDIAQKMLESGNMAGYRAVTSIRPPTNVNADPETFARDYENYRQDLAEAVGQYGESLADTGQGILGRLPISIQGKVISIANDFGSKDIVKKYNATVDAINIINGISPRSTNPSDHQQIVFAFAKALDPESVVREGEYETIKKYSQSLASKYKKEFTNAINGTGFLSEEAIKNIQSTMNNTFASRKPVYENAAKETSRIINNIAGADVADEIMVDYAGGFTPVDNTDTGVVKIKGQDVKVGSIISNSKGQQGKVNADGSITPLDFSQAGNASASNQVKGFLDSKVYRFENLSPELDAGFPTIQQVEIPKTSRLAYVNNNPGNLKFAGQTGAVEGEKGFARFSTPEAGAKALMSQIKLDASRGHTLKSFINKFAPPTENDTKLYIEQVAKMLGVTPDTKIERVDIKKLAAAIAKKESSTTLM
jgi:hypothetical protein